MKKKKDRAGCVTFSLASTLPPQQCLASLPNAPSTRLPALHKHDTSTERKTATVCEIDTFFIILKEQQLRAVLYAVSYHRQPKM